jgi:4-hydroxymandelate oxidase
MSSSERAAGAAPQVHGLPPGVHTLADHEAHARTLLDAATWAYFNGGAADEITLRANASAWQALCLLPRVLRDVAGGHTRIELLGRTLAHPLIVAPMAYQRLAHADGEIATAIAASTQGAGYVLSTQASVPLEVVSRAVLDDPGRGPLWFQLYFQRERAATLALAQRAEAAGYEALVLTVDAPVSGARDAERRAGFRLPPGIRAVNLPPAQGSQPAPGDSGVFDGLMKAAPTWADVAWLQGATRLPVILKGVLHPDDACQAQRMNLAALIVSNHGGRTLDTVPPTGWVLPRIADALAGGTPLLVDGGIRRGTDVLKAIALGADAVLVGRPCLWGLATAGAVGVAHVLRLLRDELEMAMALCGVATLQQVSAGTVFKLDTPSASSD